MRTNREIDFCGKRSVRLIQKTLATHPYPPHLPHQHPENSFFAREGDPPKKMQKQLNIDWKLLCDRLLANKISLNSKKTEMIIFQKPGLKINWDWNIRLNGYKLTRSDQIKYLGIYLDKYLNGHYQTKLVIQKLARSLGMLSKVRH